jgi:hypothetical protein
VRCGALGYQRGSSFRTRRAPSAGSDLVRGMGSAWDRAVRHLISTGYLSRESIEATPDES